MEDDNILKFKLTVDSSGLGEFETKSTKAFSGVKKAVEDLTGFSTAGLRQMNNALEGTVSKFNALADAVGVSPSELKQILSYIREINKEIKQNATAQAATDAANRKATIDFNNSQLAHIRNLRALRNQADAEFTTKLQNQNKAIRQSTTELLHLMDSVFARGPSFGQNATSGFKAAFTPGQNFGVFSNILGGFGGGGRIGGAVATGLDGGLAAGGSAAAILGGLAGGAAVAAVLALASALKKAAEYVYEFGKASIQAAGDFQVTQNAIAAFTGSTSKANAELESLADTVRKTPGLELESAEKGYRNLRALGFEAETARGLIAGLAKQRLISGADESAVQRVVVNLTQLSSQSNRASQDLREIFHALPSLRKEFFQAFGTLDPQKLAKEFSQDADKALEKLSAQMEKTKGVQGGLNAAVTDFGNEWEQTKRAFGGPFLESLTNVLKNLTADLHDNKDLFITWGNSVAGVLNLIADIGETRIFSLIRMLGRVTMAINSGGVTEVTSGVGGFIRYASDKLGYSEPGKDILTGAPMRGLVGIKKADGSLIEPLTPEEQLTQADNARYKAQLQADGQKAQQLKDLKDGYEYGKSLSADYYADEEAKLAAHNVYTKQQELDQLKEISALKVEGLRRQLADAEAYFNAEIKLEGADGAKARELELAKGKTINQIRSQIARQQISDAAQIKRKELDLLKERRTNEIKQNDLMLADVKRYEAKIVDATKDGIELGNESAITGYAKLRDIADAAFVEILTLTQDNFRIRLQDESLSAEAIQNIKVEAKQAETQLIIDHNKEIRSLDKQLYQQQMGDLKKHSTDTKNFLNSQSGVFAALGSFFSTKGAVGRFSIDKLNAAVNTPELTKLFNQRRVINGRVQQLQKLDADNFAAPSLGGKFDVKLNDNIAASLSKESESLKKVNEQIRELGGVEFPQALIDLEHLGKDMAKGKGGIDGFDKAAKKMLEIKHTLESANLDTEIESIKDQIELATKAGNKSDVVDLKAQLAVLSNNKITLGIQQQAEAIAQYDESFEGLSARLEKLRSGDIDTILGVQDDTRKNIGKERISLLENNIELEYRLAHIGEDSADRYRNAWLNAIYDIRKASEDAKVEQVTAQAQIADQTVFHADVARAGILKAMAGAKGYTEIFQDAFLGVTSAISDGIAGMMDKATEHLGAFGKILSNIATQLLTMVTNRLMMKVLDAILPSPGGASTGIGAGGHSSGGGNIFSSIISSIGGLFGLGGGGGGGTSISSAALQLPGGLVFGGAGGGLNPAALSLPSGMIFNAMGGGGSSITSTDTLTGAIADNAAITPSGVPQAALSLPAGMVYKGGKGISELGSLSSLLAAGLPAAAFGLFISSLSETRPVAGALKGGLVGLVASFINRSNLRRREETMRAGYINDALGQLDEILKNVQAHKYSDGNEAIQAANSVRETYRSNANSLTDKKTRGIALKEIEDRINPKIAAITAAATQLNVDLSHFGDLIPEFATGGIVPGQFGAPRLVLAHGGEIIANLRQQTPELLNAAAQAGIPGVRGGGGNAGGSGAIQVELHIGKKMQNQLFVNGAESTEGYSVLSKQSRSRSQFDDRSASF